MLHFQTMLNQLLFISRLQIKVQVLDLLLSQHTQAFTQCTTTFVKLQLLFFRAVHSTILFYLLYATIVGPNNLNIGNYRKFIWILQVVTPGQQIYFLRLPATYP